MQHMCFRFALVLLLLGTVFAKDSSNSETITVRGCLERTRQNYTVIDRHGFEYVLKGVGNKVENEVGHEVEARGNLTDDVKSGERDEKQGSNPSDNVRSVDGATLEIVNVAKDVHRIADKCR